MQQSNYPTVAPLQQVTVSGTLENGSVKYDGTFNSAFNTWFNGQTQWVSAGQGAIASALQQAALPPRLILKLLPDYPPQQDAPPASAFVVDGAAFGGALGSAIVGGATYAAAGATLGVEGEGFVVAIGLLDTVGNSAMFGLGVGGPYGAIAGGLIGLGAYGIYVWTH